MVEHLTCNERVVGSNPTGGSKTNYMKKKDLLALGFEKQRSEDEPFFYYYTLDLVSGVCLISCANDERKKKRYTVDLYEAPAVKFKTLKRLKKFIKVINKNLK